MSKISAWVAATEDEGRGYPTLRSILADMTLEELEHLSDVALNLDHQARRMWFQKLAKRYETGEEPDA